MEQVKRAVCRGCHVRCRVAVHSENGRLVKIDEDLTDIRADTMSAWLMPPCNVACPAHVDVEGYVELIAQGKYKEALTLIKNDVPFPGVIGRICPHPCETECDRALIDVPVSISALKRFVADHVKDEEPPPKVEAREERVAIIGSGPAGLSCAYYLAREGYQATIFEALPVAGGMLIAGIPEYRLPIGVVQRELRSVTNLGVEIKTNTPINKDLTLDDLFRQGYKAVFISVGAQRSKPLPVEGVEVEGVYDALPLLRDRALGKLDPNLFQGKRVLVIGGGEASMDAARTSLRLGAQEVQLVCLESKKEMPASEENVEQAVREGVILNHRWGPKRFASDNGKVSGVEFIGCTSVFDAEGRFAPTYDETRKTSFIADAVVIAIGQTCDLSFLGDDSGVEATSEGTLRVDPITLATTREGVFAGGDVQIGPATAIEAIADGKRAAVSIDRWINGEDLKVGRTVERYKPRHLGYIPFPQEPRPRQKMPALSLEERTNTFEEVDLGFTEEMAIEEASRCLGCGCLRRAAWKEWFYHPDRVNFPLKRVGERGEGKWERVSWEQALDDIAERLRSIRDNYGAEAIAFTTGTGRTCHEMEMRFLDMLGTPNFVGQSNICYAPDNVTAAAVFGWTQRPRVGAAPLGGKPGETPTNRCILLIGHDPSGSYSNIWAGVRDAKDRGVKLIVIDPRRTKTAERADIWLQVRPGTDTALLMSMINVIIEEGLYDKDFVEKWCHGFDKLVERAKEYPLERAAEITWVAADKIREAARMFATNRPAISIDGMGLQHLQNSIQSIHARFIMAGITGNIDIDGGICMGGLARCIRETELELPDLLSAEQRAKQLGADRFKLMTWPGYALISENVRRVWKQDYVIREGACAAHAPTMYRAIITGKPYPIKAVLGMGSNPMVTQGNTKLVYKALKSLDFYVVCDYWKTPSAELADYILPVASWLERPFLWSGADNNIQCGETALPSTIPGEYEHKDDYEILRQIAIRLGYGEYWPWETMEQVYSYQLTPLGVSFEEFMSKGGYDTPPLEFKKYEKMGFGTPTGKFELYSTIFEKLGYDALPQYEEPPESPISTPELAKEYPLILITGGRFFPMFHSEHRNVESTRRRHPHPLVQINPETASKLNINDGDWVWIESPRGRIRMKCQYFDGVDPRVVHCEHAWWFPELPGEEPWLHGVWESNVNVLTYDDPDKCNQLNGGWPLRTLLCKVYKVKEY